MRQEAKGAQSVVQRHDHRALPRERAAVVPLLSASPREEPAAVNPHHYRASPFGRSRPHVEVETVLGFAGDVRADVAVRLMLHAVVAESVRWARGRPRGDWLRGTPPEVAHRWRGIRNSLEHLDPTRGVHTPRKHARVDGDARTRVGGRAA